jgi:hypothetical protein
VAGRFAFVALTLGRLHFLADTLPPWVQTEDQNPLGNPKRELLKTAVPRSEFSFEVGEIGTDAPECAKRRTSRRMLSDEAELFTLGADCGTARIVASLN